VDGKHQGEGGDGLLSPGQVVHGHEAFPRRHAVVVDASEVRLVWVLRAQDGLRHKWQDLVIQVQVVKRTMCSFTCNTVMWSKSHLESTETRRVGSVKKKWVIR